jgi:hypothetical protein
LPASGCSVHSAAEASRIQCTTSWGFNGANFAALQREHVLRADCAIANPD